MPSPERFHASRHRAANVMRFVIGVAIAVTALSLSAATTLASTAPLPPTSEPTSSVPGGTALDNDFIPTSRNLSDCISANPLPGCGSENRAGWRQYLLLLALVIAVIVILWRIVRAVRDRDRALAGPPE